MVNMDRLDMKYDSVKMFGKIIEEDSKKITMDVKYPIDLEGLITVSPKDVESVTHGVYVPTQYRTPTKSVTTTKRKSKKCKCK
jgi:hypothetical protein